MKPPTFPGGDPIADDATEQESPLVRLGLSVDLIGRQLADDRADRARRHAERPVRGAVQRAGTVPATGPLILDLGVPAMGHRWNVRNVTVSNANGVRTAAAGTADVYVGNPAAYSPVAWRWGLAALPASEGFSADRVEVIPGDHLFVVVEGGTAGDVLMARADFLDYPSERGRAVIPV